MINQSQSSQLNSKEIRLQDQPHVYLKVGRIGGEIQILQKDFEPMQNYNYRMIRNLPAESELHHAQNLYTDRYQIDPQNEFPTEEVAVKRLSNLYGLTNIPNFIDLQKQPTHLDNAGNQPHCIKELGLFDTLYYKRLFITQTWSQTGKYVLTANIDGRFQTISVDDRVPIYKKDLEPVWGLSYDRPWEIILIKAWAKIKGGYDRIRQHTKAFEFVETFSNSTWKYYNIQIQKQAQMFLKRYSQDSKYRNGKIILKTKQEDSVKGIMDINGFVSNSACYQLLALFPEIDKASKTPSYVIAIRSTDQAKYRNQVSFYNKKCQKYYQPGMNLQHDFLMTHTQFMSVFSSAYITSNRIQDYYTGYKLLEIPKNYKKAAHLQFYIPTDGFFDFNIKQFSQNLIQPHQELKMDYSSIQICQNTGQNISQRYLKTRYILVKDNGEQSVAQSHFRTSILGSHARDYCLPRFTTYQIQYAKGYNKGNAHFVKLQKGRYILRFKSETVNIDAKYVINWISSHKIGLQVAKLSQGQKVQLLHDSMVSIMHRFSHFNFNREQKTQMITIANAYDEIGYSFVAVQCANQCGRSVVLEVDPQKLKLQGYRLKGRYKELSNSDQKFCIKIEKGEYASVIFKPLVQKPVWPSQAFNLFKKQLEKSVIQSNDPSVKAPIKGESKIAKKQLQ